MRQAPAADPLPADGHRLCPPAGNAVLGVHPGRHRGMAVCVTGPVLDELAPLLPALACVGADDVIRVSRFRGPIGGVAARGLIDEHTPGGVVLLAGLRHALAHTALE